jgi:excisionase family DNA binding protein
MPPRLLCRTESHLYITVAEARRFLSSATPTRGEERVQAEKTLPVYLSLEEAAEVMSLSVKTIRRRIADGMIPAYQCGRRPIRIKLEAALRRIPSARW